MAGQRDGRTSSKIAQSSTAETSAAEAGATEAGATENGTLKEGVPPIWEQEADEPGKWFARFDVFRALGPGRTLAETHRLIARAEGLTAARPNRRWTHSAQHWRWRERAAAWDKAERARLRKLEAERRFDAREARLGMIDRLLEAVFRVLAAVELDKLAQEDARSFFPSLRVFFKDLLAAQRAEWDTTGEENTQPEQVTLRADDLIRAQSALLQWQAARANLLAENSEIDGRAQITGTKSKPERKPEGDTNGGT